MEETQVVISSKSDLVIEGKSNVNRFKCFYSSNDLIDTLKVEYRRRKSIYFFENTSLNFINKRFDCGGKGINKDFHKLLRSKKFPSIKMKLNSFSYTIKEDSVLVNVTYKINGIPNNYYIPVKLEKKESHFKISGNIKINIKDFDLDPPRKVLGIVKVRDSILIKFNFLVQENKKSG